MCSVSVVSEVVVFVNSGDYACGTKVHGIVIERDVSILTTMRIMSELHREHLLLTSSVHMWQECDGQQQPKQSNMSLIIGYPAALEFDLVLFLNSYEGAAGWSFIDLDYNTHQKTIAAAETCIESVIADRDAYILDTCGESIGLDALRNARITYLNDSRFHDEVIQSRIDGRYDSYELANWIDYEEIRYHDPESHINLPMHASTDL